jgi:hypothetical protein
MTLGRVFLQGTSIGELPVNIGVYYRHRRQNILFSANPVCFEAITHDFLQLLPVPYIDDPLCLQNVVWLVDCLYSKSLPVWNVDAVTALF